jgi:hypothetical protein
MAGWRAVRPIVIGNPVSVSAWVTKDRSCSPVSRAALLSRLWKPWTSLSPTCFLPLPQHLTHNQSRHSATSSPSLISHRTSCCIGSTSYTWASPSNERGDCRSPITCPTAHQRLAIGCAQPWSPKRGRTGARGSGEIVPYGLERLEEARKAGYLVLVEGESDCWTLWYHHVPALGLPGVEMVRTLKEAYLAGIDMLYIVREPDAAGARFVQLMQQRLQAWK